ncbi:MAG: 16S rRNA (adenine(1518)-N(6)/adenine(1519)-N(6))-dimethyltransferase RsmA [Clostridiales bacterium]|nr:16S rRNA (adenine(1518)-N(6)/adenine(1519)-N(6))-dimethyltransferase RsmA [Clostridiales bacterium]
MPQHRGKTSYRTHDQVRPIKSLGQNFLRDRNVIAAIVDGAGIEENDLCIEIGPGTGALTCGAAGRARHLVAVELDRHVLGHLRRELAQQGLTMHVDESAAEPEKASCAAQTEAVSAPKAGAALDEALATKADVEVILADILKVDLTALIKEQKEKDPGIAGATLIGNLPYYITTPIIMKVLEEAVPVRSLTVMMQKEVADRILAQPGTKAYGALSVAVQYYCTVEKVADAPRQCFHPMPKVDSVVLRLDRREEKAAAPIDESLFFLCIRAGFSKRRKTLLNCFTGLFGMDKEETAKQLQAAGIDPSRRGETLSIAEFAALADHFAALKVN